MIEIVISTLLLAEGVALIVVGIRQVIKFIGFAKHGIKLKQVKLENIGRMATFIGTVIIIIFPRIAGFQDDYGGAIFLIASAIGFCLFLVGIRFINAAYKAEQETPNWIKWILKVWK